MWTAKRAAANLRSVRVKKSFRNNEINPGHCRLPPRQPQVISRARRSDPRQHQFRPQPADRGVAQDKAAAIEGGEIDHDRKPEPGPRLGLVQPLAAPGHLRALGGGQSAAIVIDNDPQPRPGTGL